MVEEKAARFRFMVGGSGCEGCSESLSGCRPESVTVSRIELPANSALAVQP